MDAERSASARSAGVSSATLGGRQLGGAAMEEVAPHRFKENGETTRRAAAGEDDTPLRSLEGIHHRRDHLLELLAREHVTHRDGNLPIATLEALHARKRGALEILLQRRRDGIGLLRGQEAQM